MAPNIEIIRTAELIKCLNVSRSTLWRWVSGGKFPKPIKMGARAFGYRRSDVETWLNEK
ncbi:AlpA family phage regulatory protein [Aeromonas hydrophila]|uniref:helix-turn-helix transcriptional regulator n=1 Tax=Aeromonas hydrophila TaxID=644 RepID=UPI001C057DCD|nr:AlpA family phage regulatory protein [Aeromonas hydrophila]